jgi:TonB family protein
MDPRLLVLIVFSAQLLVIISVADSKDPGVTLPKVISDVKPQYTPEAMQAEIEGTVIMTAVVRTDGTPGDIEITRSLDAEYGLDQQAVAALSQWRFDPAGRTARPCPSASPLRCALR